MQQEISEVNPRLNPKTGGFTYSAASVALIIASLISAAVLSAVEEYGRAYWFLSFIGSPIGIAAAVAVTVRLRKVSLKSIFPVKCRPKYYLIGLLLIFGLFFSLNQINSLFLGLFSLEESESMKKLDEFLCGLNGGWIVLGLIVIAALPAFFEEVLFRGAILNNLRDTGGIRSVLIVGFCFALYHGSPEQTVYQFIAGCLFAFVAMRSGSIIPGILMHFINNALVIIFAVSGAVDGNGYIFNKAAYFTLMALGAAALIAGIVLLLLDKTTLEKCKAGSVKGFFIYASLGIVILSIVWIVSLVALI